MDTVDGAECRGNDISLPHCLQGMLGGLADDDVMSSLPFGYVRVQQNCSWHALQLFQVSVSPCFSSSFGTAEPTPQIPVYWCDCSISFSTSISGRVEGTPYRFLVFFICSCEKHLKIWTLNFECWVSFPTLESEVFENYNRTQGESELIFISNSFYSNV